MSAAHVAPRVRAFIVRHGETLAMTHFRLSRIALARAAAGLGVQRGTLLLLEDGLRRELEVTASTGDT